MTISCSTIIVIIRVQAVVLWLSSFGGAIALSP